MHGVVVDDSARALAAATAHGFSQWNLHVSSGQSVVDPGAQATAAGYYTGMAGVSGKGRWAAEAEAAAAARGARLPTQQDASRGESESSEDDESGEAADALPDLPADSEPPAQPFSAQELAVQKKRELEEARREELVRVREGLELHPYGSWQRSTPAYAPVPAAQPTAEPFVEAKQEDTAASAKALVDPDSDEDDLTGDAVASFKFQEKQAVVSLAESVGEPGVDEKEEVGAVIKKRKIERNIRRK